MFKPAPNSLFAILLRNPWWISLLIAGLLILAAKAFLPADYWVAGALGSAPFVVIGVMAFRRQWNSLKPEQIDALLTDIREMSWPAFEKALLERHAAQGWERVNPTPGKGSGSGDLASDLVLSKGGQHLLISARRFKAARHGEDAVAALAKAVERMRETEGLCGGMYLAVGELSPAAAALARQSGIAVHNGDALARWWHGTQVKKNNSKQ